LKVWLLAGLVAGAASVVSSVTAAGGDDPARGAVVWASAGCGACHAFAKAGSSGARGGAAPNLDRWLLPDAHRLRVPVELLIFRRTYWGGRGMPAYGTSLTAQELDDVISFVAGKPFTAPSGGATPLAPQPAPPLLVTVGAAVVARWTTTARVPARGALLFAKTGCLSCHTYRGSGVRRRGARDLTRVGRTGRTARSFAAYLAAPYRRGNDLMPAYADLGANALASLGEFLARSRGEEP